MNNIIFIINIRNPEKPERAKMYDLSIQSWKHWADRNNSAVLVLEEPITDLQWMSPIFSRHYVFDLHEFADDQQICLADADTIIHPECPNFFEMTGMNYTGVLNDGDMDWCIRSIENYQYEFDTVFKKPFDIWKYINSGFMITNKKWKFVHDWLKDFYWSNDGKIRNVQKKYGTGTDQPLINLTLNELDVSLNILPYQFNMQDIVRKNLHVNDLYLKIPGIYHFNAMPGGPEQVNQFMQKTYRHFYS